jgi:putative GTP pyrophosphokinase
VSAALGVSYQGRFEAILRPAAASLEVQLRDHLVGLPHIDRIAVRAKSPARFLAKARKESSKGVARYDDPLAQIQDQIGARVVVFYGRDVEPVGARIEKYFTKVESKMIVPDTPSEFGYFGKHFILTLPHDVIPASVALDEAPSFFELQIKTLWQHAWSEAEHDIGYKPFEQLTSEHRRLLSFTAAQAWGADMIFDQLFSELGAGHKPADAKS